MALDWASPRPSFGPAIPARPAAPRSTLRHAPAARLETGQGCARGDEAAMTRLDNADHEAVRSILGHHDDGEPHEGRRSPGHIPAGDEQVPAEHGGRARLQALQPPERQPEPPGDGGADRTTLGKEPRATV